MKKVNELIENELIKIFRRKNIYILLLIGILMIVGYSIVQKITNPKVDDIVKQYEKGYERDKLYLEYQKNIDDEKYEEIVERMVLEKYAFENNIQYNILLNTENTNAPVPKDARIILMKIFDNFEIIFVFIVIAISSTIISEEYSKRTIKNLFVKPHKRTKIMCSKIITNIFLVIIIIVCMVLLQYIVGGLIFGFDSYNLDAITYNKSSQNIDVMNLTYYMLNLIINKISLYILLISISILISAFTSNIALNILISLGIYIIFNYYNIAYSPIILIVFAIIIDILSLILFQKKDIKNE